jgi:SWI/SNF-related matrix-associated actin-dependent regulator 1 of chromatin subfamily A
VAIKLRAYQEQGVDWLCDDWPHKLLADDMGLGKTPQAILAMNRLGLRTGVVVCPATLKIMWMRRLVEWGATVGNIYIVRDGKAEIPPNAEVIIVNYDLLIKKEIYKQLVARGVQYGYDFALFDESRAMKELKTQRTKRALGKAAFTHYAKRIWLLDGTPVPNRPIELFPVLSTLAPEVIYPYNTYNAFGEYFCKGRQSIFGWDMRGASNIEELSNRLTNSRFFLRRTKEEVMDDLPEKVETYIELDILPPSDLSDTHISTVRHDLGVAKIPAAVDYIRTVLAEAGKVVVFAHHRDVVEGLRDGLIEDGAVIVYGGMDIDQKQEAIDAFITDPNIGAFIGQNIAGGSGVDGLQGVSNHAIFVEQDWSPGVMDQAIDRLRRIGQLHDTIFVHYLVVAGSLDNDQTKVLGKKRTVISQLMKTKEVIPMTVENELKRIADALEALVKQGGVAPAAAGTSKATRGKAKEDNAPAADPAVTSSATPASDAAPPTGDAPLTQEDGLKAISRFLGGSEGEAREHLKNVIRSQVLQPKFGVGAFKELGSEHYAAFIAALAIGPEAYAQSGGSSDLDV